MKLPGRKVAYVLWDQHSFHCGGAEIVINIMKSILRYVVLFVFCSIYRSISIFCIHAHLNKKIWLCVFHDVIIPKGKSEMWCCKMSTERPDLLFWGCQKWKVFLSYEDFCELQCLIHFLSEIPETGHHCLISFPWVMRRWKLCPEGSRVLWVPISAPWLPS